MRRCTWFLVAFVCAHLSAAKIDMRDERRAVGTDDGIRIDAELTTDSVTPHMPIGVNYQVQNLTQQAVAIADKSCAASYDADSATITLSIGMEIPQNGVMPHLTVIAPGAKRTFTTGASFTRPGMPHFVAIRVNLLRDPDAFRDITEHQRLSDAQFDRWIDTNEAIELNVVPVRYQPPLLARTNDASQR